MMREIELFLGFMAGVAVCGVVWFALVVLP